MRTPTGRNGRPHLWTQQPHTLRLIPGGGGALLPDGRRPRTTSIVAPIPFAKKRDPRTAPRSRAGRGRVHPLRAHAPRAPPRAGGAPRPADAVCQRAPRRRAAAAAAAGAPPRARGTDPRRPLRADCGALPRPATRVGGRAPLSPPAGRGLDPPAAPLPRSGVWGWASFFSNTQTHTHFGAGHGACERFATRLARCPARL